MSLYLLANYIVMSNTISGRQVIEEVKEVEILPKSREQVGEILKSRKLDALLFTKTKQYLEHICHLLSARDFLFHD